MTFQIEYVDLPARHLVALTLLTITVEVRTRVDAEIHAQLCLRRELAAAELYGQSASEIQYWRLWQWLVSTELESHELILATMGSIGLLEASVSGNEAGENKIIFHKIRPTPLTSAPPLSPEQRGQKSSRYIGRGSDYYLGAIMRL